MAESYGDRANFRNGSIASIERRPWHVGFTPDTGRIAATHRTDVMVQKQKCRSVCRQPVSSRQARHFQF